MLVGGSPSDVGVNDNERRAVALLLRYTEGVLKAVKIIGIRHTSDVPAVGHKSCGDILSEGPVGVSLDGDVVVVPHPDEVVEF